MLKLETREEFIINGPQRNYCFVLGTCYYLLNVCAFIKSSSYSGCSVLVKDGHCCYLLKPFVQTAGKFSDFSPPLLLQMNVTKFMVRVDPEI